jgi:hypothetical protein
MVLALFSLTQPANVEDTMHQAIEPHELTKIDLARFQVVQVSDGTHTVVLWEAPEPATNRLKHIDACTLTIRLCDPLNPVRRKDVCERLQAHLAASRETRHGLRNPSDVSAAVTPPRNANIARQRTHESSGSA